MGTVENYVDDCTDNFGDSVYAPFSTLFSMVIQIGNPQQFTNYSTVLSRNRRYLHSYDYY